MTLCPLVLNCKMTILKESHIIIFLRFVQCFFPLNCVCLFRHEDGSYLLSHVSGDSSVYLYRSTKDHIRGAYNLHDAHCNAPKEPSSLSVPWVPLNPNLLLKYHIQHGRPPCSFPPAPEDTGIHKVSVQVVKYCDPSLACGFLHIPNTGGRH